MLQTAFHSKLSLTPPQRIMETTASNYVAPIAQKDRIKFLDCIRGLALLGILIMNITGQGQIFNLYENMDVRHPLTGLNFLILCYS